MATIDLKKHCYSCQDEQILHLDIEPIVKVVDGVKVAEMPKLDMKPCRRCTGEKYGLSFSPKPPAKPAGPPAPAAASGLQKPPATPSMKP